LKIKNFFDKLFFKITVLETVLNFLILKSKNKTCKMITIMKEDLYISKTKNKNYFK